MRSRWEVECELQNVMMVEHRSKRTVRVTAEKQVNAERSAQLEACRAMGLSTMFHGYMKIRSIKNIGQA